MTTTTGSHHTRMAEEEHQAEGVVVELPPTPLAQVLEWIGFTAAQRITLSEDFGALQSIENLTHKDINNLATGYAARTVNDGRMFFGLARTKRLQALIHWVADFGRVGLAPTIDGLDQESFREALQVATQHADIRASEDDSADARAKEASPGKL